VTVSAEALGENMGNPFSEFNRSRYRAASRSKRVTLSEFTFYHGVLQEKGKTGTDGGKHS
jgi:hypothetical protein